MCVNPSQKEVSEEFQISPFRRALILGGGLSGLLAARELTEQGFQPIIASCGQSPSSLYCAAPGFDLELFRDTVSRETRAVETVKESGPPEIRREGAVFRARFRNGEERLFGSIFFAPCSEDGSSLDGLPAGAENLSPELSAKGSETVAFLLDWCGDSDPAAGMWAIKLALDTMWAGGRSFVFFRHAPVRHLFGEGLYEQAKKSGARFFRFGDRPPTVIEMSEGSDSGRRFTVTVLDVIDGGPELAIQCDRVIVAGGLEAKSIPSWAKELAGTLADYEVSPSANNIHGHSGRLIARGVYAVGEITGERDLVRVMSQTAAAAAHARSWTRKASADVGTKTVSVEEACIRCLTCLRVCPSRAISFTAGASRSTIEVQGALCLECGLCVSECPRTALAAAEGSSGPLPEMKLALDALSPEGKLVVFGCERSAGRALSDAGLPENVRLVAAPCAGRVSEILIWNALAEGATGVLIIGCHDGSCASDSGTRFAAERVNRALKALSVMEGVGDRVRFFAAAANEEARLLRIIKEFG